MANQFLLANAAPHLERSFSAHFTPPTSATTTTPTRVLFHGTSIARLLPILTQGLRVCSNTPLQANGRAHGHGIYMAEEPATTWSYATPITPALTWRRSAFRNVRVLLGCEYVGTSQPRQAGIHVISDPTQLMLRYIFLVPENANAPVARHIEPAMMGVFSSLRSGSA